jgi:hypothetical protein
MSFAAMQWALEQKGLRALDKWVLFMLAYRDNPEPPHGCFPSIARIADDCGTSRPSVKRAIKRLAQQGKLTITHRSSEASGLTSSFYSLPGVFYTPRVTQTLGIPQETLPRVTGSLPLGSQGTPKGSSLTESLKVETQTSLALSPLPDWVPKEPWDDWTDMRKRQHRALTPRAIKLAVSTLAKLKAEGHDPKAVLEQSTLNSWQGLFEVRTNGNGHRPPSWEEQRDAEQKRAIERGTELARRSMGETLRQKPQR